MNILSLFFPLYFVIATLFFTAIETTLFPNLGVPSVCTPDLSLALITFLASYSLGWRSLLAAIGISLTVPLCKGTLGILQPAIMLFVFLVGCRLNQTIFMNNIFPQAFFAGCAKLIITIFLGLAVSPAPPLGKVLIVASGCALTTTLFAFPILSYLNTLQERFQEFNPDSIVS
ncbi:hypothetical protein KAI46_13455 [bacterium]|nr:hypothetical protein [bacterium]